MLVPVFARGFAVSDTNLANIEESKVDHWKKAGQLVREFNEYVASKDRLESTLLPFFDGVAEIRLRADKVAAD